MSYYLDLSRRFRDLTQAELESPELLASLNDSRWRSSDGWTELLQCPRVLLLAEAGAGKTIEMREQAARLVAEGKPAFFIALESLDREPLTESLSPAEERAFEAWKVDGQSTAWFFLDAVDELKLTKGKLERALGRLAKAIDGLLHRAHVVISCRPYDWRPSVDMATVRSKLPITPVQPISLPNSDDTFLAALRKQEGGRKVDKKVAVVDSPRVVVLLPLNERQIVTLARSLGVGDTTAFMSEIRRRDALTFARRPLDLVELVTVWKANGRLGTRAEQHAANVLAKLKDGPDRPDRGLLSDERARNGAERLALALALTHTRTIRSPEQALDVDRSDGVLDPAEILTDWTEEERQTLLRRALFDPATYGRVRFHHRSVQEYLAACRLRALREKGMSVKCLKHLLFAERYGVPLVIPSMQAIAAWLALWNDDVRRELMAREPETLLSMGDPESLPILARSQLLRAFTQAYGEGGWRGLNIPIDEVRRLADPKLAGVVRELWDAKPTSPDVRELLLETIWQGQLGDCADIARAAAFDVGRPENQRVTAIRALVACGKPEVLREVSNSILYEPAMWPNRVVYAVAADLFPHVLSVAELIALIQRTPRESNNTVGGFSWAMREIVETIEPSSDLTIELRDAITDLVWRGRFERQDWYHLRGHFDHIAPALARLCHRQLDSKETAPSIDTHLIWACVVANRFGAHERAADELFKSLKKHFEKRTELRETAFWSELKLISEAARAEEVGDRCFRAQYNSLIERLTADDRPWLLEALRQSSEAPEHRSIAIHALLPLWSLHGRDQADLDELLAAVQDDADLTATLLERSAPPETNPVHERWQRRERRQKLVADGRERQRLEKWAQWKKELCSYPKEAFAAEKLPTTRQNLYFWLEAHHGSGGHYNVWDIDALREAFGHDIAAQASAAFRAVWREHPPTPRSQRPAEQRNTILWLWAEGLTGLAAEAMTPGWTAHLTPDEARFAMVYATIEINGFPSWIKDLAASHPAVVTAVIEAELMAELALTQEHSQTLQNLAQSDMSVTRLVAPSLLARLPNWPSVFQSEECSRRSEHHLRQVLRILSDVIEDHQRATIAAVCGQKFSGDPKAPLALAWLRGLFRFDPEGATKALEDGLARLPEQDRSVLAIETFANLFGDRNTSLVFSDDNRRAATLGRLVRCSYGYVRPGEDQDHEGVYTPDLRDRAETGRNFLLSALLDTTGAKAREVVLDLAADPIFAHFPDRLRLLARQRAASDAEGAALKPEEVVTLEKRLEAQPYDRDGLFTVMMDRLDDLAHDVAHDDLTDRRTLQAIQEESEMQRTLARRLRDAEKGAYMVSREEEVADLKKTDIRLAARRGEQKAAIEVKIVDKGWTLTELEQALRAQLVGQYLRHNTCKAGCLLLTYNGTKKYWEHPETGDRLSFTEMVEQLRRSAQVIEQELGYEVRLGVFPLDLTNPPIEPVPPNRFQAIR